MDFELKIADVKDLSHVARIGDLAFRCFFETDKNREELIPYVEEAFSRHNLLKEYNSKENVFLLAGNRNRMLGFARLWAEDVNEAPNNSLKMERLYQLPEMLGKGVGAFLMQSSIDYCKCRNIEHLWLQVYRPNSRAISFYRKWGFVEFHESPAKFEADNEIDLWMKLEI